MTNANRHSGLRMAGMIAAAAIIVTACSSSATPSPSTAAGGSPAASGGGSAPLFVAINKSADQQYFIDLQNSFEADDRGRGGQAKKFDAKLDPNLGVSLVNDAISAGAKGIAITVPDQTIGPAIAKATSDARSP